MRIKITTDSTCDIAPALLAEEDIGTLPLYVVKDGVDYKDGLEINSADIFAHVEAGGALCGTAAVGVADYHAYFSELLTGYDAIIHVNIGSEFSACHQNACLATEKMPNVFPIDSCNLSTGQGIVALEAARLARAGQQPAEIITALKSLIPRIEGSFLIDRLDYLHRGGRCSAIAALGANVLRLKPCIQVAGGRMGVGKKYRGQYDACIRTYTKERLQGRTDIDTSRVYLTYAGATKQTVAAAEEIIRACCPQAEVIHATAGCTIACHCGPNTLGMFVIKNT
ncbi:MAG: DegV family protein [Christensenellaceae bacterium]|jgi:DegV family protein with EDD domain|nr:DegV family protein [Christensenellaceae bacterium]